MEPKKKFSTRVDRRSKRAMAEFLANHFRYHTMNSWNLASSYANNVKIYNVIPDELQDKAYEILEADHYDQINQLVADFDAEHDYQYQAGFNGRSGGYLVLYKGGWKPSEHKRICRDCGQKNFQATATKCGRCGSENMHDYSGKEIFTRPGLGVDYDSDRVRGAYTLEDFLEWEMFELRDRVELVQEFDQLCDDVVAEVISLCEAFDVEEETVMVPHTVKVLRAKEDA